MRNCGIFAVTAFVLSLLIGFVSRTTMPMLIIRPLIFAVLFFAISAGGNILISRFLPELMEEGALDEGVYKPGSKINILEDDNPSYSTSTPASDEYVPINLGQVSTGAKPDDSEDDLGDISELTEKSSFSASFGGNDSAVSGIDQNAKELYTDNEGLSNSVVPDFSKIFSPEPPFEVSAGGQARVARASANAGANGGANFGAKTESFLNSDETLPDLDSMAGAFMSDSSGEEQGASEYSAPSSGRRQSSNKAPKWAEDFNPKEMAMGLRTALSKDKEG
jgi:hypothetical protein